MLQIGQISLSSEQKIHFTFAGTVQNLIDAFGKLEDKYFGVEMKFRSKFL